jgi:hypothetical protein
MNTLADQLMDILSPRLDKAMELGSKRMAGWISDQMQENTYQGHGFGQDPYDNDYRPQSVYERNRLGLSTGVVTLRRGNNRIENTKIEYTQGTGATIEFVEGGQIFKEHHLGEALTAPFNRNVPMRSIFPKSKDSVPNDIVEDTQTYVWEVLSGRK